MWEDLPRETFAQIWEWLPLEDKKSVFRTCTALQKLSTGLIKTLELSFPDALEAAKNLARLPFLPHEGVSLLRRDGMTLRMVRTQNFSQVEDQGVPSTDSLLPTVLDVLIHHPQGNILALVSNLTLAGWILEEEVGTLLSRAYMEATRQLTGLCLQQCCLMSQHHHLVFLETAPVEHLEQLVVCKCDQARRHLEGQEPSPRSHCFSPSFSRCIYLRSLYYDSAVCEVTRRDAEVLSKLQKLQHCKLPRALVWFGGLEALLEHLPDLVVLEAESLQPHASSSTPSSAVKLREVVIRGFGQTDSWCPLSDTCRALPLEHLHTLQFGEPVGGDFGLHVTVDSLIAQLEDWEQAASTLAPHHALLQRGVCITLMGAPGDYLAHSPLLEGLAPIAGHIKGVRVERWQGALDALPPLCSRGFPISILSFSTFEGLDVLPTSDQRFPSVKNVIIDRCVSDLDGGQQDGSPSSCINVVKAGLQSLSLWLPSLKAVKLCGGGEAVAVLMKHKDLLMGGLSIDLDIVRGSGSTGAVPPGMIREPWG